MGKVTALHQSYITLCGFFNISNPPPLETILFIKNSYFTALFPVSFHDGRRGEGALMERVSAGLLAVIRWLSCMNKISLENNDQKGQKISILLK